MLFRSTTFVPGSLRLDDTALSDAADADAGSCDGRTVDIALGDAAPAVVRTIQFQVQIQ